MGVGFLRTSVRCLTISAMMVALCALLLPSAHADGLVPLGGGSGIVVEGDTFCTLTAIGNDNRGNLIGVTSAHCGGPDGSLLVRRDVAAAPAAWADPQPGVWAAGRLRRTRDRPPPAGRHDSRCL